MTHADQIRDCIHHDTDPEFPYEVNRYGCRVFVLIAIPQFVEGRCLDSEQILNLIARGKAVDEVITNELMKCGRQEHLLINWAFEVLGSNRHGQQVGWAPEHVARDNWQYMVQHWETAGPDGHFILADRAQKEIYNPSRDPAIEMKRIVRRLCYSTWST